VQKAGGFEKLGWERYELGEGRVLTYEADHVKWYDSYEDVTAIMRLLEDVNIFNQERSEDVYAARFVRIGEEYNDIEEENYGDYHEYEIYDMLPVYRYAEFIL